MDREFSDFISNVLDKTDIVSLISRYVKVERKGGTYWACCPFHHETQPSFSITPSKQLFHCFGCGVSGNALSFVMKMENIEFIDALKMLAEQAGMEMPKPKAGSFHSGIDKRQRDTLLNLMRDAARHYHENLSSPRAKVFNDYIAEREMSPQIVRKFGLGASLDFTEMLDYLKGKGYTYEQMHAAGIAESKDGREYDVFGKRLMYPIIDNMGNVVAFGGRTLEKEVNFAKYRNSSQTDIFDKSRVIYGINLLKKRKSKGPIDYVIMTEGYMDVIALHKAGFDTAVASMGTALTTRQARQIKLYSDLVYISYDGDSAGQKATMRGLDILRECGLTVKVVRLPEGLDPDDVIKRYGTEGYQRLLDEAVPLTAHKIDVLKSKYNLDDPDQKAQFAIESSTSVVMSLDNPIEQEQYFDYVAKLTGFSVDALKQQANFSAKAVMQKREQEQEREREREQAQIGESARVEYDNAVRFFLFCLINAEPYVNYDKDVTAAMPDAFTATLYSWCRDNNGFKPGDVFTAFGYENSALSELYDYRGLPGDGEKKFMEVQNELYRRALSKELEELLALYKSTGDEKYKEKAGVITVELAKIKKYHS
ncbi:MAG: DNA primase [Clostridiales bacterium]|nr:DNA primase [Clostridiales bacterium]